MTLQRALRGPLGRAVGEGVDVLAATAEGVVLELGLAVPRTYPRAVDSVKAVEGPQDLDAVEEVDTIVSVCELWRPVWGPHQLAALVERLTPGGRLLLVEPVAVTGASGWVQGRVRALTLATTGLVFDRDLPAELRRAGLTPTAVVRTSVDPWGRVRTVARAVLARR